MEEVLKDDNREALEILFSLQPDILLQISSEDENKNILHLAMMKNARECVTYILENTKLKCFINQPDSKGESPLHLAIHKCAKSEVFGLWIVGKLLNHGADINCRNKDGESLLHVLGNYASTSKGNVCNRFLLLTAKLLLSSPEIDVNAISYASQTPMMKITEKLSSSKGSEIELCQILLLHGATITDAVKRLFAELDIDSSPKSIAQTQNFASVVYNSIITRNLSQMDLNETHIESIFSSNRYIGAKSLLFLLIKENMPIEQLLKVVQMKTCNMWIQNVDDGKLPLHAALTRGNVNIVSAILGGMRAEANNSKIDLRPFSFNLVQTVLCNIKPSFRSSDQFDHVKCLELLLGSSRLDFSQANQSGSCSIAQLVSWMGNPKIQSMFQSKLQITENLLETSSGKYFNLLKSSIR